MEEKERYIIDHFGEDIFDTKIEDYPSNQMICETLNQQDKQIKELEQENLILKEQNKLLIDEEEYISKKMQEVGFDNIEDLCNSQKQVSEGTITVDGNLTVNNRLSMSDGIKYNKVYIWGYELCNGAEWNDFLKCVEEKGQENAELKKENAQLKQQLHDLPKKIVGEIRDIAEDYWDFNICEECGNVPDLNALTTKDFDEILETILKKYGGEDDLR